VAATPTIDGDRLLARLAALAAIGATADGGVTREAYGVDDVRARDLVASWMGEVALDATVDPAGNLVGRRPGTAGRGSRWLVTGSHLDTVVSAGPLDGAYGVVAAVEVAAALVGTPLAHGLAAVAFANEEGARGSAGMAGSRAVVGELPGAELAALDDEGVTLADRLRRSGGAPDDLAGAVWAPDDVAAFVELHVEQGPVLHANGDELGVVTSITGRRAVDLVLTGAANHAGTTPMDLRADAAAALAEIVLAVERLALDGRVRVATCGHLVVAPNVRNVVPGAARVSVELRDTDGDVLDAATAELVRVVGDIGRRRGIGVVVEPGQRVAPAPCDPSLVACLTAAAEASGRRWRLMTSGAGHDAQVLAAHLPAGMVFVPSVDGVSHSPLERTDAGQLVAGAQLLCDALVRLDRELG
jgi:allantoate deiminase